VTFRPARESDLEELTAVQRDTSVPALAEVFPQETHPFPFDDVLQRWREELADPGIAVYVSTGDDGRITGFAARRDDEILHFGVAVDEWGSGLAAGLLADLLATYPPEVTRIRLRAFEGNPRGRAFWEKHGWRLTGGSSRSGFPPHALLLDYERER
jgi:RimJ/RimL family protein N-acetyltransferase